MSMNTNPNGAPTREWLDIAPQPFLDDLEPAARAALLTMARPIRRASGDELIRFGQPSRGAFVLSSGSAEVRRALPGGGTLAVACLREGSLFGEASLIEQGITTASVVATSPVEGWFFDRDSFRAFVAQTGCAARQVQLALTRVLIGRLRTLNSTVLDCPTRTPPGEGATLRQTAGPTDLQTADLSFPVVDFADKFAFFAGFEPEDIAAILALGTVVAGDRGCRVFNAGDTATRFFLTVRGAVEVGDHVDGEFRRLAVLGPGQALGHASLLTDGVHTLAARVRETAILLEIEAAKFFGSCCDDSSFAAKIQRSVQHALLNAIHRTNTQLTRRVSERSLAASVLTDLG